MTGNPYDEYLTRVMSKIDDHPDDWVYPLEDRRALLNLRDVRGLLADAWLSGLAYSLNLVEGEKEKRNVHTT